MPDSARKQIKDALRTKLLTISGIGTRVYTYYRPIEDCVEGFPAICIWAAEDAKGIVNTRLKAGLLKIGIVAYQAGGDVDAKIETLLQGIETAIETDPMLGLTAMIADYQGISGARVTSIATASIGITEGTGNDTQGFADVTVEIPYRHQAASP